MQYKKSISLSLFIIVKIKLDSANITLLYAFTIP